MSERPEKPPDANVDKAVRSNRSCGGSNAKPIRRHHPHHEGGWPRDEEQPEREGVDGRSRNAVEQQKNQRNACTDRGPYQKIGKDLRVSGRSPPPRRLRTPAILITHASHCRPNVHNEPRGHKPRWQEERSPRRLHCVVRRFVWHGRIALPGDRQVGSRFQFLPAARSCPYRDLSSIGTRPGSSRHGGHL